jgi:hypothetical protein
MKETFKNATQAAIYFMTKAHELLEEKDLLQFKFFTREIPHHKSPSPTGELIPYRCVKIGNLYFKIHKGPEQFECGINQILKKYPDLNLKFWKERDSFNVTTYYVDCNKNPKSSFRENYQIKHNIYKNSGFIERVSFEEWLEIEEIILSQKSKSVLS